MSSPSNRLLEDLLGGQRTAAAVAAELSYLRKLENKAPPEVNYSSIYARSAAVYTLFWSTNPFRSNCCCSVCCTIVLGEVPGAMIHIIPWVRSSLRLVVENLLLFDTCFVATLPRRCRMPSCRSCSLYTNRVVGVVLMCFIIDFQSGRALFWTTHGHLKRHRSLQIEKKEKKKNSAGVESTILLVNTAVPIARSILHVYKHEVCSQAPAWGLQTAFRSRHGFPQLFRLVLILPPVLLRCTTQRWLITWPAVSWVCQLALQSISSFNERTKSISLSLYFYCCCCGSLYLYELLFRVLYSYVVVFFCSSNTNVDSCIFFV